VTDHSEAEWHEAADLLVIPREQRVAPSREVVREGLIRQVVEGQAAKAALARRRAERDERRFTDDDDVTFEVAWR
jgi:hypothetical protein